MRNRWINGAVLGVLLAVTAVVSTGLMYYMLIPGALGIKNALLGGVLFSVLLVASRMGYWIYIRYSGDAISSVYGAFSALILIMLWVHFVSHCFIFSCLYAYHLHQLGLEQAEV